MAKSFFLDWMPVATAPWATNHSVLQQDTIPPFKTLKIEDPFSVDVIYRRDGFFIYVIPETIVENVTQLGKDLDKQLLLQKLASHISRELREKKGFLGSPLSSKPSRLPAWLERFYILGILQRPTSSRRSFEAISLGPVQLTNCDLQRLKSTPVAGAPDPIVELEAKNYSGNSNESFPAILKLRREFAKCYEKAIHIRPELRRKRIPFIPKLRKHSFWPPLWLWLALALLASVQATLTRLENTEHGWLLSYKTFGAEFAENLLVIALLPLIFTYFLVISGRRNPTIYGLRRASKVLHLGNVFCDCASRVKGLVDNSSDASDFSHAISDTQLRLEEEEEKRRVNLRWMLIVFALCFWPIEKRWSQNCFLDHMFSAILPWHESPEENKIGC